MLYICSYGSVRYADRIQLLHTPVDNYTPPRALLPKNRISTAATHAQPLATYLSLSIHMSLSLYPYMYMYMYVCVYIYIYTYV